MKNFMLATMAFAIGVFTVEASEANLGFYKFEKQCGIQNICLSDGTKLVCLIPQLHIPEGKRFSWGNFRYPKNAKCSEKDGVLEYSNTGFHKKESEQNGVKLNANIQVYYKLTFDSKGKVTAHYEFSNNGDSVFLEPYCNIKINPELLKNQKGVIYKIDEKSKAFNFGEQTQASSIDYRGGNPKDLRVLKMEFNTTLGKPFVIESGTKAHMRLKSKGAIMVYNTEHFAKHIYKQPLDWKEFKPGEKFAIDFVLELPKRSKIAPEKKQAAANKKRNSAKLVEKTLPVVIDKVEEIDIFKYEKENRPERAIIKNGTFYRKGKPVFFVGPWLGSHFEDNAKKIPVKEFHGMPSHNKVFNAEIAQQVGFNTCHPQYMGFDTLKKAGVFDRYPNYIKSRETCIEGLAKGYKNMPLVVDYAHIGWLFDNHWRKWFKKEIFQKNTQCHGFVPFNLAHPSAWKVQKTFWQDGARTFLKYGANPWIYELFNEPSYDSRDEINQKAFIDALSKKYKSIEEVNKIWGSNFKSFEQIVSSPVVERQKGLQVEWFKFIEDQWIDILKKGKQVILEVDKRPDVYFSQQRGISLTFLTTRNGFDEYKIARAMDVVNTEGGITFKFGKAIKSDNPMDEYMNTNMTMHLDMCRAVAEEKPVIDTEQSTRRYSSTGRRIPSKKGDLVLMLWNQAIHGSSMSLLYNWGKRSWQWKPQNIKGAEEFVNKPGMGWAAGCLLNPYCYPKEALGGIKEFDNQIERLAEIVLPRPRIKGVVALLLSNSSRRYTGSIEAEFTLLYQAATITNFPKDVLFEEQLPKGFAQKYKAIVSPFCRYVNPKTLPLLQKYVKDGGVLILNGMDLESDEYGKAIDGNSFIGLKKRQKLTMPIPAKMRLSIDPEPGYSKEPLSVKMNVVPVLGEAKAIAVSEQRAIPLVTLKKLGKGRIYYVACELNKSAWATVLSSILKDAGLKKTFALRAENGSLLPGIEAQVIDRSSKRLYYFANWKNISEMAKLSIKDISHGEWTLSFPKTNALLKSPSGKDFWSASELSEGVLVFCPGWEAQLLLVESGKNSFDKSISIAEMKFDFQKRKAQDKMYAEKVAANMKLHIAREKELNTYPSVNKANCVPIDISKQCNMGFKDEINGDKKGGTSDQGDNDLSSFPTGRQTLSGVPFNIINPEKNNGTSMITLRSKERPYFPEIAKDIPVNNKFKLIYFLHTKLWGGKNALYIVHYSDGSELKIPLVSGKNIRGWWNPRRPENGKLAWSGKNAQAKIGVYCWKWDNLYPEKEIKSIDVKTQGMLLGTIAMTGEK